MATMLFRNLDKDTKEYLQIYAVEHGINMGQALGEIVQAAKEQIAKENLK